MKSTRMAALGRRVGMALLGFVAGLLVAEGVFWWLDEGAFPHVNLYVPDDELGVRLEPGATQRLKFRDNPVTDIRINEMGLRGGPVGDPAKDRILVLGDSQVFGLGVEEEQTFSAVLASKTGRPVVNAGIPTYGPPEYEAFARELLEEGGASLVVYTVNMVNDLFEAERPNRDRHAVWDGWAVRRETAPTDTFDFPGRELLYRHSHMFYALRRWQWESRTDPEAVDRGFESEGVFTDLLHAGETSAQSHKKAAKKAEAHEATRESRLAAVQKKLDKVLDDIEEGMYEEFRELDHGSGDKGLRFQAARGNPGDIVRDDYVEEGREIAITARTIRLGVMYRNALERRLRKFGRGDEVVAKMEERNRLWQERAQIRSLPDLPAHVPTVLAPRLTAMKALAEEHGARLVVLVLPMDVQVSKDEWEKYGAKDPPDMEGTLVLIDDILHTAEAMGVSALSGTEALRGVAGPAFLKHDIHMTPAGHRALGEALAELVATPPPAPLPERGLPVGRTRVPSPEEWLRTPEAIVRGSSKAGCETVLIHEWFRATCLHQGKKNVPTGVTMVKGGHGEAMVVVTKEGTTLVTPVLRGDEVLADFSWQDRTQRLVIRWPKGEDAPSEMFFEPPSGDGKPLEVSKHAERLCACHKEVENEKVCEIDPEWNWPTGECAPTCVNLYGAPREECFQAFGDDCGALLKCVRGDPAALPPCPPGWDNAGGSGQCFRLCSDERPCDSAKVCAPWRGSGICVDKRASG